MNVWIKWIYVFAAPVREVDIRWVENKITCMSEGIYPEPELTWTTSPLSHLSPPDRPTVQQTEQQLYSISSSLTLSDGSIDSYSCVVSAGNSSRKVTIFKPSKCLHHRLGPTDMRGNISLSLSLSLPKCRLFLHVHTVNTLFN